MADARRIVKDIISACRRNGWQVEHRKHWVVTPPVKGARPVFIGSTPSDHRAVQNIRASLRRAGATFI